jgi:hypothetical protein
MGTECGHRTLVVTRKGGKVVTIPLAPRTARATGLARFWLMQVGIGSGIDERHHHGKGTIATPLLASAT